jgi:WD40 repeat protein
VVRRSLRSLIIAIFASLLLINAGYAALVPPPIQRSERAGSAVKASNDTENGQLYGACVSPITLGPPTGLEQPVARRTFTFDFNALSDITLSDGGTKVAAYTALGSAIALWETSNGQLIRYYKGANPLANHVHLQFALNDQWLIGSVSSTAGSTHRIAFISLKAGSLREVGVIQDSPFVLPMSIDSFAYSDEIHRLVTLSDDKIGMSIMIFDISGIPKLPILVKAISLPADFGSTMAFSANGKVFVVGSSAGDILVYRTSDWTVVTTIHAFPADETESGEFYSDVVALAVSPSGRFIAAGAGLINLVRHRPASLSPGQRDPNIGSEPFSSTNVRFPIRLFDLDLGLVLNPTRKRNSANCPALLVK